MQTRLEPGTASPDAVPALVEGLFRRESGRILATLVRALGPERIDLAEDAVQEALLRALRSWPFGGVPENPAAWLMRTARNHALDRLRRARVADGSADAVAAMHEHAGADPAAPDEHLQMLFMCCHPALPPAAQLALTLRAVVGLSTAEIARALLEDEPAVAQRLVRAKRRIAEEGIPLELPAAAELDRRLDVVLHTLYLTFTAGHSAMTGDQLVRPELCGEAIRLASLLGADPRTDLPAVDALLALMHLAAARLPARLAGDGTPLRLRDQDRSRWDGRALQLGFHYLRRSMRGGRLTAYHLEAEIASIHALAPSFDATDWPRIVELYDRLHRLAPSPLVALNREVARAQAAGPAASLPGLRRLERSLAGYYPYHLAVADALDALGRREAATAARRRALALAATGPVQAWIGAQLGE